MLNVAESSQQLCEMAMIQRSEVTSPRSLSSQGKDLESEHNQSDPNACLRPFCSITLVEHSSPFLHLTALPQGVTHFGVFFEAFEEVPHYFPIQMNNFHFDINIWSDSCVYLSPSSLFHSVPQTYNHV